MGDFLDVDKIIKTLLEGKLNKKGKVLKRSEIEMLCRRASGIFLSQPMLLELEAPLKICGDIHGQYTDLLKLFGFGGFPPEANYLFLGDYVDRGKQSLETICLLLAYKVKYPENFFLLRGNHEVASVCRVYGFFDECKRRYNIKIFKTFTDVFNTLPVAAVIDDKIFCCHGGLSPDLLHLSQITHIKRPTDIPQSGLLCDLLWSDPSPDPGWRSNDRGVSFTFGEDVVHQFLHKHNLDLICRGHMVVEDGYEFFGHRRLVTVFSAPNYCGEFDNAGALMSVDGELVCSFQILTPIKGLTRSALTGTTSKKHSKNDKKSPPTEVPSEILEAARRLKHVDLNPDNPPSQNTKNPCTDNSSEFLSKLMTLKTTQGNITTRGPPTEQVTQPSPPALPKSAKSIVKKPQRKYYASSSSSLAPSDNPEFLDKAKSLRRVNSAKLPSDFRSPPSNSEKTDPQIDETINNVKKMAQIYQQSHKKSFLK